MFQVIQKHRRVVMVFIFIFIGIPLAFMVPGATDSNNGGVGNGIVIMDVDGTEVYAHELLVPYSAEVDARTKQNRPDKAVDLVSDGTLDRLIDSLVQRVILSQKTSQNAVIPNEQYLAGKLKEDLFFKNQKGEFVPAKYNEWVQGNDRGGIIWEEFYADYAKGVNQEAFLQLIRASARIAESEIHEQYFESQRKMKVRYFSLDPAVEVTEEDLKALHASNPEPYMSFPENTVDYVRFSLIQPIPELVLDVLAKAHAGEDFSALAQEHSVGANKVAGGDLGWVPISETPVGQAANFSALAVGEISDPVRFFSEIYLYKVEGERVNEETQVTEKQVRRIIFRPEFDPSERAAIQAAADAFLEKVQTTEGTDLRKAAAEAGLDVTTSPSFSAYSNEIDGIATNDLNSFRQALGALEAGAVSAVVSGSDYLFVAKQVDSKDPAPQDIEVVRDSLVRDATATKKASPEHQALLAAYFETINTQAHSLDELVTLFPELTIEIKTPSIAFGPQDFLFNEGIFWNVGEVFAQLSQKKQGELLAPVVDFQGINYVLELSEVIVPDAETFEADWNEKKEALIDQVRQGVQYARQSDYMKFMAEQAKDNGKVMQYPEKIYASIGLSIDIPAAETATDAAPATEGEPLVPEATDEAEVTDEAAETPVAEDVI